MARNDGNTPPRGRSGKRVGHRMHRRTSAARKLAKRGQGRKGAGWGRWAV
jgi:hypothetical protein